MAANVCRTKTCGRCGKPIYGRSTGKSTVHDECRTEEERARLEKRRAWKAAWRARQKDDMNYQIRTGRSPSRPLDPEVERDQPLLVVTRAITVAEVLHLYVASVMVECHGDFTAARRTLGMTSISLRRFLARIESGQVRKCRLVQKSRDTHSRVAAK